VADARRALKECAEFTRGGGPPTPDHDANHAARAKRLEAETERLIKWAQVHGFLGNRLPPEYTRGGEHYVFYQRRRRRYLKATLPHRHKGFGIALGSFVHGATPSEYLDRLDLQNLIFEDDILLESIVVKDEKAMIVTSQPAIKGLPPSQEALDELMKGKGYELLAEGAYYDERRGLRIFDLFPRNAIQVANGAVYPFDPVIQRISVEFALFLREHPYTINLR
jgi:hypothetical protein